MSMRKFKIKIDGKVFEAEVEEIEGTGEAEQTKQAVTGETKKETYTPPASTPKPALSGSTCSTAPSQRSSWGLA